MSLSNPHGSAWILEVVRDEPPNRGNAGIENRKMAADVLTNLLGREASKWGGGGTAIYYNPNPVLVLGDMSEIFNSHGCSV